MRGFAVTAALLILMAPAAQATLVLNEDFTDISDWNDLSLAVSWGGYSTPTSAFTTTGGQATLTTTAKSYTGYTSANQLKTFTCLDKQFATAIDRTNPSTNVITVTFCAKWQSGSPSSEGSRFVVSLTHDYPTGGLDMDYNDRYDDFDRDWWARPAYNMRIRPSASDSNLLVYGGGHDVEGEFEVYGTSWWLPGFSSAPGGASPSPTAHGCAGAGLNTYSKTEFKYYKYVVTATQQELWYDAEGDGFEPDDLLGTQSLVGNALGLDSLGYRIDFPTIDGIRLYWRGANASQAEIDWLTVHVTPEPATLLLVGAGAAFVGLRNRRSRRR